MSPIEIPVPPQDDPPGQSYYVTLETTGLPIKVHGRSEDAYIAGSTTINGSEIFADLAFRMSYDYESQSFFNDLQSWVTNARYLIPLIVTIFFPGWAILELSGIRRNYSVCEQVALSLGLSLAFFPLLFLWSSVFKLPLSRNSVLWILGILTIAIILRFAFRKLRLIKSGDIRQLIHIDLIDFFHSREIAIFITLTIIIMGSFMVRLAMVRDLATPPWVDSVHHA
ncbi:MAG: DUF1616 domain-containing protein, partial [Bacteroidales bacterium]|nr:DUF1616 domain-containing protein [Bacteroidales bacterium]